MYPFKFIGTGCLVAQQTLFRSSRKLKLEVLLKIQTHRLKNSLELEDMRKGTQRICYDKQLQLPATSSYRRNVRTAGELHQSDRLHGRQATKAPSSTSTPSSAKQARTKMSWVSHYVFQSKEMHTKENLGETMRKESKRRALDFSTCSHRWSEKIRAHLSTGKTVTTWKNLRRQSASKPLAGDELCNAHVVVVVEKLLPRKNHKRTFLVCKRSGEAA